MEAAAWAPKVSMLGLGLAHRGEGMVRVKKDQTAGLG